ncbi:MAG: acylphosphatase [Deltaproteobacteria bacterium]|nr:acylphosphatase [Deltaproteobacteria bacterium]MBN2846574.1 acylphosphatase [Deltaproteobacteria bacterium]
MNKRVHLIISGRVQGVFFRAETQNQALRLQLKGWVRNMSDGRVEIVIEGDEGNVQRMIAWCHKGPRLARVEKVDYHEELFQDSFNKFEIVY